MDMTNISMITRSKRLSITAGELIEHFANTSEERDELRAELHLISELALIASTLDGPSKNTLLTVIHDRASLKNKIARGT